MVMLAALTNNHDGPPSQYTGRALTTPICLIRCHRRFEGRSRSV